MDRATMASIRDICFGGSTTSSAISSQPSDLNQQAHLYLDILRAIHLHAVQNVPWREVIEMIRNIVAETNPNPNLWPALESCLRSWRWQIALDFLTAARDMFHRTSTPTATSRPLRVTSTSTTPTPSTSTKWSPALFEKFSEAYMSDPDASIAEVMCKLKGLSSISAENSSSSSSWSREYQSASGSASDSADFNVEGIHMGSAGGRGGERTVDDDLELEELTKGLQMLKVEVEDARRQKVLVRSNG
ncbi:hypothetical protein HK102_007599 [Quaeritorhiza haematococci]|nr:hypothetical protein HK102_007599 [Quaeritorhiza haematococci]